jgi:hypothetical protein
MKRLLSGLLLYTILKGSTMDRIIAERLNEAGYQTKAGKAWDKDIYSAWKPGAQRWEVIGRL